MENNLLTRGRRSETADHRLKETYIVYPPVAKLGSDSIFVYVREDKAPRGLVAASSWSLGMTCNARGYLVDNKCLRDNHCIFFSVFLQVDTLFFCQPL